MSHFSVLVIGPDPEKQLAPYHEFECTGVDDEFIQDIDTTDEERADFEASTISMIRMPDGREFGRYDDFCYRDPTPEEQKKIGPNPMGSCYSASISYVTKHWNDGRGLGYHAKIHYLPEGAIEFEKPYPSFAAYLRENHHENFVVPFGEEPDLAEDHKYGYALLDEKGEITKVINRTNPNKQWDWCVVGGRFRDKLFLKTGNRADQAEKGHVDFEKIRELAVRKAGVLYDRVAQITQDRTWKTFAESGNRDAYWGQPVLQDFAKSELKKEYFFLTLDDFLCTKEEYLQTAKEEAFATFAVVKDGQWHERGSMGWWGMVSNEEDPKEWTKKFNELVEGLPDNTLLTVVDCHI